MREIVYIEGIGNCEIVTVTQYNEDGVPHSYNEYIPVEDLTIC